LYFSDNADDYLKARQKAKLAEDTSNLESEVEVDGARPKRRRYVLIVLPPVITLIIHMGLALNLLHVFATAESLCITDLPTVISRSLIIIIVDYGRRQNASVSTSLATCYYYIHVLPIMYWNSF